MSGPALLAFDGFELHLDSGELFRDGNPVRLQPQPARVLEVLARRSGDVVGLEEIQALVWGEDTYLDADASLNFCIRQIRRALDDPASAPRYIETIPRRGYRFLAPVREQARMASVPAPQPSAPAGPEASAPTVATRIGSLPPRHVRFLGIVVALTLIALGLLTAMQRPIPPGAALKGAEPPRTEIPAVAREHYLRALYLRESNREEAREELKQAILDAPDFAEAHALLAWVERRLEAPPEKVMPELELTARRAVELGPDLAQAHLALGEVLLYYKLDWSGAERELRRAVALDPGHAEAWHSLALLLASLGRHEEAIANTRRARDLDPAAMLVNSDLAWFYYLDRQYDEAVRQAASTLELKTAKERRAPLFGREKFFVRWTLQVILYCSLQTGDRRAGLDAARQLMRELGHPREAERLAGVEEFLHWERQQMLALSGSDRSHPYSFAHNAAAAGQPELALSALEEACRRKWPEVLISAAADPLFDPLRGDPRFDRFLDCIGMPADAPARRQ